MSRYRVFTISVVGRSDMRFSLSCFEYTNFRAPGNQFAAVVLLTLWFQGFPKLISRYRGLSISVPQLPESLFSAIVFSTFRFRAPPEYEFPANAFLTFRFRSNLIGINFQLS